MRARKYEREFTIDRSKWVVGGYPDLGPAMLLNSKGNMCCLGHISQQCGLRGLRGVAGPGALKEANERVPFLVPTGYLSGGGGESKLTPDAIEINDNPRLSQKERETALKELFAKHKIKLTFVGRFKGKR